MSVNGTQSEFRQKGKVEPMEIDRNDRRVAELRKQIRRDLKELPPIVRWLLILLSPGVREALFDE